MKIPEGHEEFGAKLNYKFGPNLQYRSTAYAESRDPATGIVYGENKYTESPLRLQWNDEREQWEELE